MASVTWDEIIHYAREAGAKFPEVVAAQFWLESGGGEHTSGKNNYFGIKGAPGTTVSTQEWNGFKFITIQDTFKDFASAEACVFHLVKQWYLDYGTFRGVNRASNRDECAKLLVEEHYATDPKYSEKLIRIMNEHAPATEDKACFLEQAAVHFVSEPHQEAAWKWLEQTLDTKTLEEFKTRYRAKQEVSAKPSQGGPIKFPLAVPYFYQRDSKTGHGERMCFSSSMAMAIEYIDPDAIEGDDDAYLREVLKRGDTVSSDAQVKTANELGVPCRFSNTGSQKNLEALLDRGIPVPIGILHKGSVDHPTGGGHWICLIGHDSNNFMVNDPFGELDLMNGGYPKAGPTDGKNQRYSKKNLMRRWLIASDSDGWYVDFG
jgi:hypothetical protein